MNNTKVSVVNSEEFMNTRVEELPEDDCGVKHFRPRFLQDVFLLFFSLLRAEKRSKVEEKKESSGNNKSDITPLNH